MSGTGNMFAGFAAQRDREQGRIEREVTRGRTGPARDSEEDGQVEMVNLDAPARLTLSLPTWAKVALKTRAAREGTTVALLVRNWIGTWAAGYLPRD